MDDEAYQKLSVRLNKLHYSVLKEDVLDNPALTGDYMTQIRGYANFILPYINRAIDAVSEADGAVSKAREKLYAENTANGMSPSAAEKDARERTRLLEHKLNNAQRGVDKLRNDYKRYDSLVLVMQSRLKEFNTERIMDGKI